MRAWVAMVGVIVGVSVAAYALFGRQTDQERIAARLDQLEKAVHVDEETTNLVVLQGRVYDAFQILFVENVNFDVPGLATGAGCSQLAHYAFLGTAQYRVLDVDFHDVDIGIKKAGKSAQVRAVARVQAERGGAVEREERTVNFDFVNGNMGWMIESVRVQEVEAR